MTWGVRSPVKRLLVLAGCTVGQTQSCRRELTALARATAAKGVLSWPAGSSLLTRPSVFRRRAVTRGSQNSDSDPVTDVWPRRPSDARTLLPSVFRGAVSSCSPRASPTPSSVLGDPSPSALPRHAGSALCAQPPQLSPSPSASVGNVICSDGFGRHPCADDSQIHRSLPSNG